MRDDVETVHVDFRPLKGMQRLIATARIRGRGFLHYAARQRRAVRKAHLATLQQLLERNAFTAAHFAPAGLSDLVRHAGLHIPYSVGLDTTVTLRGDGQGTNRWLRRCDGDLYTHASFVAPMSQQAARSLESDFDISSDRIVVTPPAIDVDLFSGQKWTPDMPRLFFVGNDWQRKGGPELLRWYRQYFSGRCELHIVGDVGASHQADSGIIFHGPVPRAVLARDLLPSAIALVLPSRLEMTPWVVVEAAAAGVPIIASDVGAVRETVREGKTGFLLHPGSAEVDFVQAVEALLADPALVTQLGSNARAHVRETNLRDVVLGRLFERLIEI